MITTDEDEALLPLHTNANGQLTQRTSDSGHYGSNGVLEDLERSVSKL